MFELKIYFRLIGRYYSRICKYVFQIVIKTTYILDILFKPPNHMEASTKLGAYKQFRQVLEITQKRLILGVFCVKDRF